MSTSTEISIEPKRTSGLYIRWTKSNDAIHIDTDNTTQPIAQPVRTNLNLFSFNGFGDKFFLLGAVYFLALGLGWKPVLHLFLIHQGITLLALLSLFLAIGLHPAWLYPMNFLVTYFVPAATGMFVLTVGRRR